MSGGDVGPLEQDPAGEDASRFVWTAWTLANAVGYAAVAAIAVGVPGGGGVWLIGVPLGVAQWVALRTVAPVIFLDWLKATYLGIIWAAIVGTIVGVAVAIVLSPLSSSSTGNAIGSAIMYGAGGAAGAIALATKQLRVFRRDGTSGRVWVGAHALAFGLPLAIFWQQIDAPSMPLLSGIAGGAVFGCVVGAITGIGLTRLIRESRSA